MANIATKKPIQLDLQVGCIEAYTPSGSPISSTFYGKPLKYAFFQTDLDCTITVTCLAGNSQPITIKGGVPYPYAVTKITAVSGGAIVYILHNGY